MTHLKCIPVFFLLLFVITIEAQDCEPNIGIQNNYNSISQVRILRDMPCRVPDCPERGPIIIDPDEERTNSNAVNSVYPINMNDPKWDGAPFKYIQFIPHTMTKKFYWTAWVDYNNDNVIDHATEIVKAVGKQEVYAEINLSYTSGPVRLQVVMSRSAYNYPCSSFKRGDYLFVETYIYDSQLSDKIETPGLSSQVELDYEIYPNPARDIVNVQISDEFSKGAILTLFNGAGQKMINTSVDLYRGKAKATLDVAHLSSGVYHLHVQTASESTIETIILQ